MKSIREYLSNFLKGILQFRKNLILFNFRRNCNPPNFFNFLEFTHTNLSNILTFLTNNKNSPISYPFKSKQNIEFQCNRWRLRLYLSLDNA